MLLKAQELVGAAPMFPVFLQLPPNGAKLPFTHSAGLQSVSKLIFKVSMLPLSGSNLLYSPETSDLRE